MSWVDDWDADVLPQEALQATPGGDPEQTPNAANDDDGPEDQVEDVPVT